MKLIIAWWLAVLRPIPVADTGRKTPRERGKSSQALTKQSTRKNNHNKGLKESAKRRRNVDQ